MNDNENQSAPPLTKSFEQALTDVETHLPPLVEPEAQDTQDVKTCEWETVAPARICGQPGRWEDRSGKVYCEEHGYHLIKRFAGLVRVLGIPDASKVGVEVQSLGITDAPSDSVAAVLQKAREVVTLWQGRVHQREIDEQANKISKAVEELSVLVDGYTVADRVSSPTSPSVAPSVVVGVEEKRWEVYYCSAPYTRIVAGEREFIIEGMRHEQMAKDIVDAHNASLELPEALESGGDHFEKWYIAYGIPLGIRRDNCRIIYDRARSTLEEKEPSSALTQLHSTLRYLPWWFDESQGLLHLSGDIKLGFDRKNFVRVREVTRLHNLDMANLVEKLLSSLSNAASALPLFEETNLSGGADVETQAGKVETPQPVAQTLSPSVLPPILQMERLCEALRKADEGLGIIDSVLARHLFPEGAHRAHIESLREANQELLSSHGVSSPVISVELEHSEEKEALTRNHREGQKCQLGELVASWSSLAAAYRAVPSSDAQMEQARQLDICAMDLAQFVHNPICANCGKTATCFGQYEEMQSGFACDDCCGHGNEDGRCEPVSGQTVSDGGGSHATGVESPESPVLEWMHSEVKAQRATCECQKCREFRENSASPVSSVEQEAEQDLRNTPSH